MRCCRILDQSISLALAVVALLMTIQAAVALRLGLLASETLLPDALWDPLQEGGHSGERNEGCDRGAHDESFRWQVRYALRKHGKALIYLAKAAIDLIHLGL